MRFKTFIWPNDPKNLNITMVKNSKIHYLPSLGPTRYQVGIDYRIIEGTGEFFGSKCYKQFSKLTKVFTESSSGELSISPLPPIKAFFSELSMLESPGPNIIRYKFKFIEDLSCVNRSKSTTNQTFYHLKENENLWNIANKFDIKIENILKNNPLISNPYDVSSNQKVII